MGLSINKSLTYIGSTPIVDQWTRSGITFQPNQTYIIDSDNVARLLATGLFAGRDIENNPATGIPSLTSAQLAAIGGPAGLGGSPTAPVLVTVNGVLSQCNGMTVIPVAPTIKSLFLPSDIPGLALWVDAQDAVYTASFAARCTALGDQAVQWTDKSGNAVALTASATKPTFDPAGINGYPAIQFSANSYYTTGNILTSADGNAMTWFVVAKPNPSASTNRGMLSISGVNAWLAINNTNGNSDVTLNGITGWTGLPNPQISNEGVWGLAIGGASTYVVHEKVGANGAGGSVTTLSKATGGTIVLTTNAMQIGAIGGSFIWDGWIGEVLVYHGQLTAAQFQKVYSYLANKWGYSDKGTIVACGDSLSSGTNSTGGATQVISVSGTNYPSRLWNAVQSKYIVRTDAYPGRTLTQALSESPSFTDVMVTPGKGKQIALVWLGTNTLATDRLDQKAKTQLAQYCIARKNAGFDHVVVMTCLPRLDTGQAAFETNRSSLNSYIRSNYLSFCDGYIDLDTIPQLSDPNNTTYYAADKVHLTDTSYQLVANAVQAYLSSIWVF